MPITDPYYVAAPPTLPVQLAPAPLARLDVDAVTRDAFAANNAALSGYLRQIAPLPTWRTGSDCTIDAEPRGVAAPHESHERSRRYGWTLAAIVALSIVATGGLAFTAYQVGMIAHVGLTVAVWIGAGGSLAIYLVQRLQAHDLEHSPEAIALVTARANAYATETGADAQAGLCAAYADTLRVQAAAHAATVKASAAALTAEVQRQSAPPPQRRRVALATGSAQVDPWHWERDADGTPHPVPDPVAPPATDPAAPLPAPTFTPAAPPVAHGVDPVTATVLAWVALLYDDPTALDAKTRRITVELPWSTRARGPYALPKAERERVRDVLLNLDPPLFAELPGNALALAWRFKWSALRLVGGAL